MYGLLITIAIIDAVLLVIVVLLQSSKGEGLAGIAGGAASGMNSTFGTRRTADFLSKSSWWLGGGLLVISVVINLFFLPGAATNSEKNSIIQSSRQQSAIPTQPALPKPVATPPTTGSSKQPKPKSK